MIYNKVNSDYYLAAPYGRKVFIWFTYLNRKNVCFIMEITSKRNCNISDINILNIDFDWELSYGTILYGTKIINKKLEIISIEDIFTYKSKNMREINFGERIHIMKNIITQNIHQGKDNKYKKTLIGFPIMHTNYDMFIQKLLECPYSIYSIQCRNFKEVNSYKHFKYNVNMQISYAKFIVKPTLQNDIYYLYYYNEKDDLTYYNVACIPDYKTSVMMNSIFRNIKENRNLDFLEESDSEEEFENTNSDKFVDLEKKYAMKCVFMPKFKKWKPIEKYDDFENVINSKTIDKYI